jgi:DNA-binding transcriptional MocR family regulator
MPLELLQDAAESFFRQADPQQLNYGDRPGDRPFREALGHFLSAEYGSEVTPESLFVTGGNSQALDLVCTRFSRPGDTVIVEEPSYFLAFRIFEDHGLEIVPVATDRNGLRIDELEKVLERTRPRLLYTIPSYHNPGGFSLSHERRHRLADLAQNHGFTIVADEVYQMLWYAEPPPPPMGALAQQAPILSLGSFSKILAPGTRLGWIQAAGSLLQPLLDAGVVNSGGALNQLSSMLVTEAMNSGRQSAFLAGLRQAYRERVAVMDECLHRYFTGRARWRRPEGGYFFWLEFDEGTDIAALREKASHYQVGFQPGRNSSSRGELNHCMRLSFAHYQEQAIRDGMARLARLFDEHAKR